MLNYMFRSTSGHPQDRNWSLKHNEEQNILCLNIELNYKHY